MTERYEDIIHNGQVVGQRLVSDAPLPTTSPRMTHYYFMSRFLPAERTTIRSNAATDATLDDALFLFNQAKHIDVTHKDTQNLVHYMAQKLYIASYRPAELLAEAPIGEEGVL